MVDHPMTGITEPHPGVRRRRSTDTLSVMSILPPPYVLVDVAPRPTPRPKTPERYGLDFAGLQLTSIGPWFADIKDVHTTEIAGWQHSTDTPEITRQLLDDLRTTVEEGNRLIRDIQPYTMTKFSSAFEFFFNTISTIFNISFSLGQLVSSSPAHAEKVSQYPHVKDLGLLPQLFASLHANAAANIPWVKVDSISGEEAAAVSTTARPPKHEKLVSDWTDDVWKQYGLRLTFCVTRLTCLGVILQAQKL